MAAKLQDKTLSRREIEALIADGRKIVIVDGKVLQADAWLPYHPGGDKAILHLVGRDATDQVRAFHSADTQRFMRKYQIARLDRRWSDFVPPMQGGVFRTRAELEAGMGSKQATVDDEVDDWLSTLPIDHPVTPAQKATTADFRTQQELLHDLNTYPSLDAATQTTIITKYRALDARIHAEGLYSCNYTAYLVESLRYTVIALTSYCLLHAGRYYLSAIFLGIFWHQLVFTVHDAGHMGITHNFHLDTCIGILVSNFLGGLSCCWWKRNHNVHHIVTNSAEHDPDIQHMPFFAISHRFFASLKSTYYDRVMTYDPFAKFMLRYQHYLYYPILTFGRFNLYLLSWQYIFLGQGPRKGPAWWHRYLEIAGQLFFWYWFGYLTVYKSIPTAWERFAFVMLSHAITMPVHVQITLSHFAMSTADLGVAECFPQRMLRTTMDVECPEWLDFFHGGLQFQAVHHLFPRIPRHNLRRTQKLVLDFCEDVGIPYAIYDFAQGNGKVIGRLGEIAQQARVMAECQRSMTVGQLLEGH